MSACRTFLRYAASKNGVTLKLGVGVVQRPLKMAPFDRSWNSLSADLRDPTCSDEFFRRSLKTFLFAKYKCVERIRGLSTTMCYINRHYLSIYLSIYLSYTTFYWSAIVCIAVCCTIFKLFDVE